MDQRARGLLWTFALALLLVAVPQTTADAFVGMDTFTYGYRDLELTVTITAGEDPGGATVEVAVRIPDQGSVLIGGVRGVGVDRGFPRGSALRGRLTSLELVGPDGDVHQVALPRAARRPFRAGNEARLARGFARRTGQVIYRLYGDFFGLDDL